jgi:A118 family predicted phage portal protein
MFSQIWQKIKEAIKKLLGNKTVEQALHTMPIVSNKMANAIELWADMYEGNAPWLHEPTFNDPTRVISLGLPSFIASEKARMAVLEMKSEITTPVETVEEPNLDYKPPETDKNGNITAVSGQTPTIINERPISDTARAEYLDKQYKKLLAKIRTQLEYGIAKGGLIIKPYIILSNAEKPENDANNDIETTSEIQFDYIQADNFFPLAFDGSGKITEAAFIQSRVDKNTVYRRLEYHKLQGNTVIVQNRAFKSTNTTQTNDINSETDLGQEINLTDVPEWASLQPEVKIQNVDRLLFAYFKMPEANTVDPHSPLGVSGYSRAVGLIQEADKQYSRLLWEFEATEAAIDIDRDALQDREIIDDRGIKRTVSSMGHLQQRLFRPIDLGDSNTYEPFLPSIRDTSLINGLNNILMRIEDVCALSRGTISDVAAEARTATELKILKQRSYSANAEIQKELESTLKDVVYIMNVYCTLYNITPEGEYDVSFEWDDSILSDVDSELSKRITLMQNGLASKVETRMWYFGETERQAREALQKISDENQQSMENEVMNRFGE